LFVKTWRVSQIVNVKAFKKVIITQKQINRILVALVLTVGVMLAVLTGVGKPRQVLVSSEAANQVTSLTRCSFDYIQIHDVFFAVEAVALVYGAKLCWETKDVPDAVNESKFIAAAMTLILLVCIMVFPIVFLLNLAPMIQQLIASLAFGLCTISTLAILFGPKIYTLWIENDDLHLHSKKNDGSGRNGGSQKAKPVAGGGPGGSVRDPKGEKGEKKNEDRQGKGQGQVRDYHNDIMSYQKENFKQWPREAQPELCHAQIALWTAALMRLNTGLSTGSGSGSASVSANHSRNSSISNMYDPAGSKAASDAEGYVYDPTALDPAFVDLRRNSATGTMPNPTLLPSQSTQSSQNRLNPMTPLPSNSSLDPSSPFHVPAASQRKLNPRALPAVGHERSLQSMHQSVSVSVFQEDEEHLVVIK
jgi:hypothetical protein